MIVDVSEPLSPSDPVEFASTAHLPILSLLCSGDYFRVSALAGSFMGGGRITWDSSVLARHLTPRAVEPASEPAFLRRVRRGSLPGHAPG
jgi:hypothetical protein